MATTDAFDRNLAKTLSAEAVEALQAVAIRHGLTLEAAGGILGTAEFTMKLKWGVQGVDRGALLFKQHAGMFGLEPDDHGKTFTANGTTYTITGLALGAAKRPVQVREVGPRGRAFVFPVGAVKRALGRKAEAWE